MPKTIPYAAIDATDRLRPVDMDHAAFLAAAFEQEGVQTPIVVTPRGAGYKLVEGGHRLAAMGLLGWQELIVGETVQIVEMDELSRRLREIDENLVRRELNPLDRALFLAERRKVYEEIHRVLGKGGDRKSEKFKAEINSATCGFEVSQRFSAEAAAKVGLSEDTIARALRIAEKLDPVAIKRLRGTKIERNQQALLALCDLTADEQVAAARYIAEGEAKTVAEARIAIGKDKAPSTDPQPRILATLIEQWERASRSTRAAFLAEIGAEFVKTAKQKAA